MNKNNIRAYRCKVCNRLLFTTEKCGQDVYLYRKFPGQKAMKILVQNCYYIKCSCKIHYRFIAARGRLSRYAKPDETEPNTTFAYPVFPEKHR